MAHLDRFLTALVSNKAKALLLSADDLARLDIGDTPRPITKQPLPGAQLLAMLKEIAPADAMRRMESGQATDFPYSSADGAFTANASFDAGRLRVAFLPVAAGSAPGAPAAAAAPQAPPAPVVAARVHENGAEDDAAARRQIDALLRLLVERGASDLHLRVGMPPIMRIDGELQRVEDTPPLDPERLGAMLRAVMPERNRADFEEVNDTDFAYEIQDIARFRGNALLERHGPAAVFRVIPAKIISADDLGLSDEVQRLAGLTKGLVLVTGPTGSGKSTTLCGLIDLVNRTRHDHVITIEDPIEFVHENKNCLITQRHVGVHTSSFKHALRAALREDPDIVLVGELRDLETMSIAIETAETGHLVFGTMHTTTAAGTVDRMIDQFPTDQQEQVRVGLAESLKGVIAQVLCRKVGGGRAAAREILLAVPAVANLIREAKTFQIPSIMQTSRRLGMLTMNDALMELVDAGTVEAKEAYSKATDRQSFATALRQHNHDTSFLEAADAAGGARVPPPPPGPAVHTGRAPAGRR